jgi:hypothetical protein
MASFVLRQPLANLKSWVVHYRDEINKRDVISSEISTREAAMDQACLLSRE